MRETEEKSPARKFYVPRERPRSDLDKGIGRVRPVRGSGPRASGGHHRAAAAALRAALAIQLLRRAPPRLCPARPGAPPPGPGAALARAATSHGTCPEPGAPRAAGVAGGAAAKGARFRPRLWGTQEAGALPLGPDRDGGGERRAEVGAPWAPGSAWLREGGGSGPRDRERPGDLGCGARPPLPLSAVPAAAARGRARPLDGAARAGVRVCGAGTAAVLPL